MELTQSASYVATIIPWSILPVFLISPIPLYLNIQIIRAYFKYEVLRRAPSDILTTLAVVYGLRDILFILMSIFSLFFVNEDGSFNESICKLVSYSSYIILYLVYTYSSALNVFLGLAAGSSTLYTDESTRRYHYSALSVTALLVIACFFWGKLYQTPATVCVYTLGAADGIVPTMFVITLFFFTYKIYKLRSKSQSSSFAAKNKTFMDTFMIYIVLSYAYTFERLIKYFVDNGSMYVPFSQLSFFSQVLYFVEYAIASLLTFTIFIIRYYDESTRKKLRIIIGLDKDNELTRKLSEGSSNRRKKSEGSRKSEEEIYSAEVKFTINMRKVILVSMIEGVSWAFDNAQEIIDNISPQELEKLPKNLNRIEDYMIKQEDLLKDNPEAGEVCKKIGVELDDARISFHNFIMTIREINTRTFSIEELMKSFSFRSNYDYLDQGFHEKDNTLSWTTHDSKFRIDIIDPNLSKVLISFWRILHDFQSKKSSCVIQPIIAVGQYISLINPTNAFFMIGRNNYMAEDMIHIHESFIIRHNEFSSFTEKKRYQELKEYLKYKAYVKPDRVDAFEDVVFLQDHSLLFSIVINVVKIMGEDRGAHEHDKYVEISFQNLTKASSPIEVMKYTKNINTIFDFVYEYN